MDVNPHCDVLGTAGAELKLAIVVTFRDEESHLPTLFASFGAQTLGADQILLVDDGSVDRSAEIAQDFSSRYPHVRYVMHPRPQWESASRATVRDRLASAPELQAFTWGVTQLDPGWDVVTKMDGDLKLPSTLFEDVRVAFGADGELGVVGAYLSVVTKAGLEREHTPKFHVRGPNKFYRRECLMDIVPLPAHLGWDTIDELRARRSGWRTYSITPRSGDVVHLRATGSHDGRLRAYWRWGRCAWGYGAHPLAVVLGGVRRSSRPPYLLAGVCYCAGWAVAGARREPRLESPTREFSQAAELRRIRQDLRKRAWNRTQTSRGVSGPVRETTFISWNAHSRPRDLAPRLGARYYVPAARLSRISWCIRYPVQAALTIGYIAVRRPRAVLFTNPPFIAGLACLLGCRLVGAECWCDCHSGAYTTRLWTRFKLANRWVLHHCTGVIYHNDAIAESSKGDARRSHVLSVFSMQDRASSEYLARPTVVGSHEQYVVAACSYGADEPVEELLLAARLLPNLAFVCTGRVPESVRTVAPRNVTFSGWLADGDYHGLLDGAAAVVALTTREATMQNGMIEALEHRRPVVMSKTAALSEWSEGIGGIRLVENNGASIAAGIADVTQSQDEWLARASAGHEAAARRGAEELSGLTAALLRPPSRL